MTTIDEAYTAQLSLPQTPQFFMYWLSGGDRLNYFHGLPSCFRIWNT